MTFRMVKGIDIFQAIEIVKNTFNVLKYEYNRNHEQLPKNLFVSAVFKVSGDWMYITFYKCRCPNKFFHDLILQFDANKIKHDSREIQKGIPAGNRKEISNELKHIRLCIFISKVLIMEVGKISTKLICKELID